MSGEGANAPELQDQLNGTNSISTQQELHQGSANGISTSVVQMTDEYDNDVLLSGFLNSDEFLVQSPPPIIIEIEDSEETLAADDILEIPSVTSELTLPPFPGEELENIAQASNPGFNDFFQSIEGFSQNVEVLHNVSENVEVFQDISQNDLLQQQQFSQDVEVFHDASQNVDVFQNAHPLQLEFSQNVEGFQNSLPLQEFSQNVEVFHGASQNAELFQNVSQNNDFPQQQQFSQNVEVFHDASQNAALQQQFDQFGNLNFGQYYGGSSSAAPIATQGTAVTGFSGGNFQMPTSNLTSQNSGSSSFQLRSPIQQAYPQEQGLQGQGARRSQTPHGSLRNVKQRLRGVQPTKSQHQKRASPLRNIMMKVTPSMTNKQSFNLQRGFQGMHRSQNPHAMEYSSLKNVMQGLQRLSIGQSQPEIGRSSSSRNASTRMQDIPSTQNPLGMGSSSSQRNVMQGLQGNYAAQNWHDVGSSSSRNAMQGFQGIYPTQNQHATGSSSSNNVMQGFQGIYPPTQNQHGMGLGRGLAPSSPNAMQGVQGIYPTQNQHGLMGPSSQNQHGLMGPSSQNQHGLMGPSSQNQHGLMQGPQAIYPSQNPLELGASASSNVMMGMDLSGNNNQQSAVPQGFSSLYPVTAQGNANPLGTPRPNEPLVYDRKYEQLGLPADPFLRQLKLRGFK